ncbi:MAG: radical SAM family heme chaperone HemW [Bdellovibrio sp.]|nr:MAG: radical SAM family heme chaperone HemW [Bdellovibrio sp.]
MAFGIYIHIPYCLQKCLYCDFSTTSLEDPISPEEYIQLIIKEISTRHQEIPEKTVDSIFLGGGTPSLLEGFFFQLLFKRFKDSGFVFSESIEISIEMNPETVSERKIEDYLKIGINRFSLGVQTFKEDFLKRCGRKHTPQHSFKALEILSKYHLNFSLDLIYALPNQTLDDLKTDLHQALEFHPLHMSVYELTVPSHHTLSQGRPIEPTQIEMRQVIQETLENHGLFKYEISNFSQKGYESIHNSLYWSQQDYWGLGVSAHSYLSPKRFWNPYHLPTYKKQILKHLKIKDLPPSQKEVLSLSQKLTELCYTSLRTTKGLCLDQLNPFGLQIKEMVLSKIKNLQKRNLITIKDNHVSLTPEGELISNQVFVELTFLPTEIEFSSS